MQLLFVRASAKCFTPSSVILLLEMSKLFSLQLLFVIASAKCFTPSSVIFLPARFKLFIVRECFSQMLYTFIGYVVTGEEV